MGMTRHAQDSGCMIQTTHQGNEVVLVSSMKYHTSWDWLMPVIIKIENDGLDPHGLIHRTLESRIIGDVYNEVVDTIKIYNDER